MLIHSNNKTALLELFALDYFLQDHMESIINVMDDLCKDPTNTYIPFRYILLTKNSKENLLNYY